MNKIMNGLVYSYSFLCADYLSFIMRLVSYRALFVKHLANTQYYIYYLK